MVLTSFDIMATQELEPGLEARLGRLKGEGVSCCVPDYEGVAKGVLTSSKFPAALTRFKALADENRLLAVALLRRRKELCACEIQAATGLTHATVSHHMSVLEAAGLVEARREGKWMFYRLVAGREVGLP